jgi:hypothetical protein
VAVKILPPFFIPPGTLAVTDWSPDGQVMLLRDGELMMSPGDIWAKPIDGEGYPPAGARHRLARQLRRGRQPVRGPAPNHGFLHLRGSS